MSDQVSRFFEETNHEESLQEQVEIATELEAIIKIAAQAGYNFNRKELSSGIQNLLNSKRHHDYILSHSEGTPVKVPEGVGGLEYLRESIKRICDQNPTKYP